MVAVWASRTRKILRAKRDKLIELFYQFKEVLDATNGTECDMPRQLRDLETCIQQCGADRVTDTFCYRLGTSPYALFSRRKITGTRELLDKVFGELQRLRS